MSLRVLLLLKQVVLPGSTTAANSVGVLRFGFDTWSIPMLVSGKVRHAQVPREKTRYVDKPIIPCGVRGKG